jgi:hypothetical protein
MQLRKDSNFGISTRSLQIVYIQQFNSKQNGVFLAERSISMLLVRTKIGTAHLQSSTKILTPANMNRRLSSKIIADYIIQAGEVWLLLRHPFDR